jgi:hypothetical protein
MSSITPADSTSSAAATPAIAEILQDHPTHRPGTTRRPHRVRVHQAQLNDRLASRDQTLTPSEHAAEVARLASDASQISPALRSAIAKSSRHLGAKRVR